MVKHRGAGSPFVEDAVQQLHRHVELLSGERAAAESDADLLQDGHAGEGLRFSGIQGYHDRHYWADARTVRTGCMADQQSCDMVAAVDIGYLYLRTKARQGWTDRVNA
jgi:hypothetical protein